MHIYMGFKRYVVLIHYELGDERKKGDKEQKIFSQSLTSMNFIV